MYYYVEASYKGYNAWKDYVLCKLNSKKAIGSGYGFGRRDFSWSYKTEYGAKQLKHMLSQIKGVKVRITKVEDD